MTRNISQITAVIVKTTASIRLAIRIASHFSELDQARRGGVSLILLVILMTITGCEIADPDWQARQDGLARSPAPPQQWDPGFGHESRQMQEWERTYGNPW